MNRFNSTERTGVNLVEKLFLSFDWIPRIVLQTDVGIDMEVEICENGKPLGKLLAIQIKTGESYFREQDTDSIIYRPSETHLDYWLNHSLPVIIILHHPGTGQTIWESINRENIQSTRKAHKIHIPKFRSLDSNSKEALQSLNAFPAPYLRILRLQSHDVLMQQVANGERIILELAIWVNKSIGRARIDIIDADDFTEDIIISSTEYIFFRGIEDLYDLFPWANFQIDEDYYHDQEEDAYTGEHGIWDPEDKKYYYPGGTYNEYKKSLPKIRPLPDHTGELETYRLEISLNDTGKGYLFELVKT